MANTADERWVPLTTAPHQIVAELWQQVLADEGIPTRLQSGDYNSYLGVTAFPVRMLVLDSDHDAAQRVLDELASAAPMGEDPPETAV